MAATFPANGCINCEPLQLPETLSGLLDSLGDWSQGNGSLRPTVLCLKGCWALPCVAALVMERLPGEKAALLAQTRQSEQGSLATGLCRRLGPPRQWRLWEAEVLGSLGIPCTSGSSWPTECSAPSCSSLNEDHLLEPKWRQSCTRRRSRRRRRLPMLVSAHDRHLPD